MLKSQDENFNTPVKLPEHIDLRDGARKTADHDLHVDARLALELAVEFGDGGSGVKRTIA